MAESRKSPRPKGQRPSKPTGASGKTGYGQSGGKSGSKPGGSKGGPKGPGKGPSGFKKSQGQAPGGQSGGPSKGPRKPRRDEDFRDAPRAKKAPAERAEKRSERIDDFDFDDLRLDDGGAPAAFPKPARPTAGRGEDRREERHRGRSEHHDDRPPRGAAPRRDESEGPEGEGKSVTAGRNPVRELLETFPRRVDTVLVRKGQREAKVQEIVALADENRIKVQFVDDAVLRRLYAGSHQGVIAITAAVEYAELDALIMSVADAPLPVLLALDKVQDPGNLGAMARTAWALGAAGIIVPRHGGAYIGAGAMRASAGALHHLPVARVTNMSQALDACAEAGLAILCADASGEDVDKASVRLPAVLVLGGEEKGVRFGVAKHCQQKLAIPFKRDFDSLNVAQAAAIILARLGRG